MLVTQTTEDILEQSNIINDDVSPVNMVCKMTLQLKCDGVVGSTFVVSCESILLRKIPISEVIASSKLSSKVHKNSAMVRQ